MLLDLTIHGVFLVPDGSMPFVRDTEDGRHDFAPPARRAIPGPSPHPLPHSLPQRESAPASQRLWDVGSARPIASLGYDALATTSGGHTGTIGRHNGQVDCEEALAHARRLAGAATLPASADLENGFGDSPEEVAETIRLAGETGLAGASIEDFKRQSERSDLSPRSRGCPFRGRRQQGGPGGGPGSGRILQSRVKDLLSLSIAREVHCLSYALGSEV
jgi:hypothetical protein